MGSYGEIEFSTEFIKNRLYFAVTYEDSAVILKNTSEIFYFNIDDELLYANYYFDFGPLNISCLYKYCCKVNSYLNSTSTLKKIVHYTCSNPNCRSNAAYLIGCYAVIYLKMEPRHVFRLLLNAGGHYRNFVDASQGPSPYTIRLIDCMQAIEKTMSFNFFDFDDFNVVEYDTHSKIQHGDLNWLVPRKFVAFIGPTENEFNHTRPPEYYATYFQKHDVKTVIRLNNKTYDASIFKLAGIQHYDLFFPDGTTPPRNILLRFLDIAEHSAGAIAVHCKAGLGRTGSLIGAYIVKHYRMPSREAIAWMRICRPGSVIGQQQEWLEKLESWLWKQGSNYRLEHFGEGDKIPRHRFGINSKLWPVHRKKILAQLEMGKLDKQSASPHSARTTMRDIVGPEEKLPTISSSTADKLRDEFRKKKLASARNSSQFENVNSYLFKTKVGETHVKKKCTFTASEIRRHKLEGKMDQVLPSQGDKLNEIKMNKQNEYETRKRYVVTDERQPTSKRREYLLDGSEPRSTKKSIRKRKLFKEPRNSQHF